MGKTLFPIMSIDSDKKQKKEISGSGESVSSAQSVFYFLNTMPIIEQEFMELTQGLDVEAFWGENEQCQAFTTNKPLGPCHNLQPNTSVENIVAMYAAAHEYGQMNS